MGGAGLTAQRRSGYAPTLCVLVLVALYIHTMNTFSTKRKKKASWRDAIDEMEGGEDGGGGSGDKKRSKFAEWHDRSSPRRASDLAVPNPTASGVKRHDHNQIPSSFTLVVTLCPSESESVESAW